MPPGCCPLRARVLSWTLLLCDSSRPPPSPPPGQLRYLLCSAICYACEMQYRGRRRRLPDQGSMCVAAMRGPDFRVWSCLQPSMSPFPSPSPRGS
eukprot:512217-Rhodomonas_salina.2